MSVNHYDIGDLIRLSTVFYSGSSTIDPAVVDLEYINPAGTSTLLHIGSLTKTSVGHYFYNIYANDTGQWWYRWYSSGTVIGAEEAQFIVDPSEFD